MEKNENKFFYLRVENKKNKKIFYMYEFYAPKTYIIVEMDPMLKKKRFSAPFLLNNNYFSKCFLIPSDSALTVVLAPVVGEPQFWKIFFDTLTWIDLSI